MKRGLCFSAVLCVLLAGCSDDSGNSTFVCADDTCPEGQHCVDNACVPEEVVTECKDETCPEGQHCVDNACATIEIKCDEGLQACGEECVDVTKDSQHCGNCDMRCQVGETCTEGQCKSNCSESEENCFGKCTDVKTDKDNCGACGTACVGDSICEEGVCKLNCQDNWKACTDTCVDIQNDSLNCGDCGTVCTGASVCVAGVCKLDCGDDALECPNVCEEGDETCSQTICIDPKTDSGNCGVCGTACSEGLFCVEGVCDILCSSSQTKCGDTCVSLNSDVENCGACGNACKDDQLCNQGTCEDICQAEQTLCGDECVDLNSSFAHCGKCSNACSEGYVCSKGQCLQSCGSDALVACLGNCIDPLTSTEFCGAKGACSEAKSESENFGGVKCLENQICSEGACICPNDGEIVCKVSSTDSLCVNPATSAENCGCNAESEGINCATLPHTTAGTCNTGKCEIVCEEGFADCDGNAENGCETELNTTDNCGACGTVCSTDNAESTSCQFGKCTPICQDGFAACDGECVSLVSDENCGACGNVCDDGFSCSNEGFCVVTECLEKDRKYAKMKYEDKEVLAYCVHDFSEFAAVRDAVNQGTVYPDAENTDNAYVLIGDIEMGTQTSWTGVGTSAYPFGGYFFGNGKSVKGTLTCVADNCGIFGYATDAKLRDFNIDLAVTSSGNRTNVGGLIGYQKGGSLSHATAKGSVQAYHSVGGVVGYCDGGKLTSVRSQMSVTGKNYAAGGIVGWGNKAVIDDCHATCEISHEYRHAGGLIGNAYGVQVSNSSSNSNVTIFGNYGGCWHAGTFVGYSTDDSVFTNCQASGNAMAEAGVGGFVGRADRSKFENCAFTKGKVTTPDGKYSNSFGGFVGNGIKAEYKNCSAAAEVDGGTEVGGFASYTEGGKYENCTSSSTVIGNMAYVGGFIGIAKANATFKNCTATGKVTATKSASSTGGFVGASYSSTFDSCNASGDVEDKGLTTGTSMGGHTGYAVSSTYTACQAAGNVTNKVGSSNTGGFVGNISASNFTDCLATGNAQGTGNVGAFAGLSSGTVKLLRCGSLGSATGVGSTNSAGLLGAFTSGAVTIDTCFATGNVTCSASGGGLVGYAGSSLKVDDSYVTGVVTGKTQGALVGGNPGNSKLANVYWWNGSNAAASSAAFAAGSIESKFDYVNGVAMVTDTSEELTKSLNKNADNWMAQTCSLATGPGTSKAAEYVIPVLKGLKLSICH